VHTKADQGQYLDLAVLGEEGVAHVAGVDVAVRTILPPAV
jgi:hypothetical protein